MKCGYTHSSQSRHMFFILVMLIFSNFFSFAFADQKKLIPTEANQCVVEKNPKPGGAPLQNCKAKPPLTAVRPAPVIPAKPTTTVKWYAHLTLIHWSETLSLTNTTTATAGSLKASQWGGILGASRWKKESNKWSWSLTTGVAFTSSSVLSDSAASFNYQSTGSSVLGVYVGGGAHWMAPQGAWSIGIDPFLLERFGFWATPAATANGNYALSSKAKLLVGALVEAHYFYKVWYFEPQMGIIGGFSNLMYGLQLGRQI